MTAIKGLFVDTNKLHSHKVQTAGIADYRQFIANVVGI